jgi:hypothetical protein
VPKARLTVAANSLAGKKGNEIRASAEGTSDSSLPIYWRVDNEIRESPEGTSDSSPPIHWRVK